MKNETTRVLPFPFWELRSSIVSTPKEILKHVVSFQYVFLSLLHLVFEISLLIISFYDSNQILPQYEELKSHHELISHCNLLTISPEPR
jgi:hypothetical protein